MRDSRKKRNTEYPGIQLKPIKPNDLDRTSVNKDAALHFLRHISEVEMAKSLLAYDVRLFRRVIPWQCLGSVWSRREQRSSSEIHTVKATVKQFNHVVYIVLATVLSPCLSLAQRAKIVEKVSKNYVTHTSYYVTFHIIITLVDTGGARESKAKKLLIVSCNYFRSPNSCSASAGKDLG